MARAAMAMKWTRSVQAHGLDADEREVRLVDKVARGKRVPGSLAAKLSVGDLEPPRKPAETARPTRHDRRPISRRGAESRLPSRSIALTRQPRPRLRARPNLPAPGMSQFADLPAGITAEPT